MYVIHTQPYILILFLIQHVGIIRIYIYIYIIYILYIWQGPFGIMRPCDGYSTFFWYVGYATYILSSRWKDCLSRSNAVPIGRFGLSSLEEVGQGSLILVLLAKFSLYLYFYMFFQLLFRRESCPWPHAHRQRYHKQQNTSVNNTRWSLCSKLLQLYKHPVPIGNGIISKNINSSDILWTSYSRYVNSTWPHAQKQRIANSGAAYDTVAFGDGAK